VGMLVHRLIDRLGIRAVEEADVDGAALALLRRDERLMTSNPRGTISAAVRSYRALAGRPDLAVRLDGALAWHEVPISSREDGVAFRGAIDTLVVGPDGRVLVLEFKTGRPSQLHERQLSRYVRATTALLPGMPVDGLLVYAGVEED